MPVDTFCFTKYNPIAIYGSNKNGINYYQKLVSDGYFVQCFVDKRAKEYNYILSIDGKKVPIYGPTEISKIDKEIIFFIAIRNAVEQNNVAKQLWEEDFQNVIFFPMLKENMQNSESLSSLKMFYRDFIGGRIHENEILPKQKVLWGTELFWDHALIEKNERYVIARVPISLLHYYDMSQSRKMVSEGGITTSHGFGEKYLDKSIFQLEWLNDLFDFLVYGKGDLVNYWELEKRIVNSIKQQSTSENQLWFSDRQKCAEILMSGINRGSDFLIQSAISVQWNKRGYFNICDGGHRLAFFNCINMNMVPVQMKFEDYKSWVNINELETFLGYIKENEITTFEAPIPHPWFYGCEVREEKCGNTILKCILNQLMKLNLYEKFSVLDVNPKDGYYLQHFTRIGARDVTGIVYDKKQYEFLSYSNQLFYMKDRINLEDMDEEKKSSRKYDIVLMLKKVCELEEQEQIRYIDWISSKAEKMIIWESGVEYEREKELILKYSGCKKYILLKRVLSENVVREVGIYLKEMC